MKKAYYLLIISLFTLNLSSCNKNENKTIHEPIYVPIIEPVKPIDEPIDDPTPVNPIQELSFNQFKECLKKTVATKIVTTESYTLSSSVSLNFSSTLRINYDQEIVAKYDYSYQKLNSLNSDASEYISTYSGTSYIRATSIGELSDGRINWNDKVEGAISLFNFDLQNDYLLNFQSKNGVVSFKVVDTKVSSFFKTNLNIQNVNFTYTLKDEKIDSSVVSFQTNLGANVEINSFYSYDVQIIDIPE